MLCALAVAAPAAVAAEDEIFVDPGSPSAKEYALPIESAREQAASEGRGTSAGTKEAPLFGEGVGADGAGGGGSDAGGSGGDGAAAKRDGRTARSQAAESDGGTPATARAQAASPDGGMGTIAILGAGAGVLLLGGAIGLVLRRRAARTT